MEIYTHKFSNVLDLENPHDATHCGLVDRLFSSGRNVFGAEVVACLVILIQTYKVTKIVK